MVEYWKDITTPQFEGEIWKDVPGFEGEYMASSYGRVKSFVQNSKGKILKQSLNRGYARIALTNKTHKQYGVHQLVMLTFIGDCPKGKEIDHINTIRNDNRLENLRYCTRQENLHNPITGRRLIKANKKSAEKRKRIVLQYTLSGEFIKRWDSAKDAGEALGIYPSAITQCCRGGYQSTCNYQWKYHDNDSPIPQKVEEVKATTQKRSILQLTLDGVLVKQWDCIRDIQRELGLNNSCITACCRGKKYFKTAGGFKWQYA